MPDSEEPWASTVVLTQDPWEVAVPWVAGSVAAKVVLVECPVEWAVACQVWQAWAVVAESGWTPREAWAVPSDFTVVLTQALWVAWVAAWALRDLQSVEDLVAEGDLQAVE